jgi:hypothetical protein
VVDASIARYSIFDRPNESDYLGLTLYNYGLTHRVGRNVSDFLSTETVGPSTGDVLWFDYDNSDTPSVGNDETFIQVGDSGAPTFTVVEGKLAVLGVHWAITDSFPATNEGESTVDTFVPSYVSDLNAVLDDQSQAVSLVPEPGTALLLGMALLGWAVRRPRAARTLER